MHDYSFDTNIRVKINVIITVFALFLPAYFDMFKTLTSIPENYSFPLSFGTVFGILYLLFDKFIWKWFATIFNVPNLNGIWIAQGISSYEDPQTKEPFSFKMEIRIKQNFSKIEIFTETDDSTSRSTMASFNTKHAVPIFRYSFENTPKNKANAELHRHPGFIELRIKDTDFLEGDYFSGKHRLRYGELSIRRKKQ